MNRHPRSSTQTSDKLRFVNPSYEERNWIRTIPDTYPDILRAPAVTYKSERDDSRIKANKYVAYARPYKGKQGLLIIGKDFRPLIVDESQPDRPSVLPLRLDRETLKGVWVFAISIYTTEGVIQIEDCIVSDGNELRSKSLFSERYKLVQKFSDCMWFNDQRFQLGWQIHIVDIFPLVRVKDAMLKVAGGNLCLMPESYTFRLLKILPVPEKKQSITTGPKYFICTPVEGKPDIYDLKDSDGNQMGRAAIQTLSISQALQHKKATGEILKVMAEWNDEFESHVVTSVL
jgi:hypothetical protein